ncbi:unnamed protein product [Rhizoctonia solani]|uniref:Transmembrane protein n=1 Tax=Rhizoctonia solani TaxID=456999 RepID=A0A8H3E251_9AGAM|nr:unnamed protein product [Rhizoctonia solani]
MAHSTNPSPPHMMQEPPLCVVDSGSGGFSGPPVHVTLPAPARTSTSRKPQPTSRNQSPPISDTQRVDLIETFFGPPPDLPPTSSEKRESDPRRVFAREAEPDTVSKYLFWYGFACPLFWLFGTIIFFTAARSSPESRRTSTDIEATDDPMPSVFGRSTKDGRRLRSLHLQVAERRWSLRCLYAWVTLLVFIVCLVLGLWAGRIGTFANR